MAGSNVQVGGNQPLKTKRVFYGGSTPLKRGQPLAYVEDAKIFLPDTDSGFESANNTADRAQSRGVLVETPTTASIPFFAGIVADSDAGKSNSWVTIIQPQRDDIVSVRVEGTTDIAVGDHLAQNNGNPYFTHIAFDAETAKFYALEAFTDAEETVILAKRL